MQHNEEDISKKQEQYREELESLKRLIEEQLGKDGETSPEPSGKEGTSPHQMVSDKNQAARGELNSASAAAKVPETRSSADAHHQADTSRHHKLEEIKKQLELLEKELATEEAPGLEPSSSADTPKTPAAGTSGAVSRPVPVDTAETVPVGGSRPPDSQLLSLNTLINSSSQTSTQEEALKIAQQQSQRQTKKEAAQIVERTAEAKKAEAATDNVAPAKQEPADTGEDDIGGEVEEIYPKPKDTLFVFPDQSVSIVVKRKRSPLKLYLAAGLLLLIACAGVAAYIVQGMLLKPVETNAPAPKKEEPEVKMLRLEFPSDRSFGTLFDTSKAPASDTEWPPYADARGVVEYPDTMKLHLVVRADHADDLTPLTKLPPKSIASLWLPSFDMSEKNLNALHSLGRVSLIYIDQELTERERDRITDGFTGSVTVTSKLPGAIVRDMTPPNQRTLVFPEGEAVGRLAIRRWNTPSAPWQYLDVARGEVEIPAKMEVQLQAGSRASDFSFLKDVDIYALHTLVLEGQHITDAAVKDISVLKGLVVLELINTRVGRAGMEAIGTIQGLQQIKIKDTQLTDADLQPLRDLPQLTTIEIVNAPKITAESFGLFRKLKVLRRLHLQQTAITPIELRNLERDLPSCAITAF